MSKKYPTGRKRVSPAMKAEQKHKFENLALVKENQTLRETHKRLKRILKEKSKKLDSTEKSYLKALKKAREMDEEIQDLKQDRNKYRFMVNELNKDYVKVDEFKREQNEKTKRSEELKKINKRMNIEMDSDRKKYQSRKSRVQELRVDEIERYKKKFKVEEERYRKEMEEKLKRSQLLHQDYIKKVGEIRLKVHKIEDSELEFLPDPNNTQEKKKLGSGGLGVVYDCNWNIPKRRIAVKEAKLNTSTPNQETIDEFLAQVALVHPNVLRVYGFTKPYAGVIRIVMERMDCDLYDFIHQKKPMMNVKIDLMRKMTEALYFLHSQEPYPILHRDIKSYNFLCSNDGKELKIADFGMVKTMENSATYIQSGVKGTCRWMAPEICGINAKYSVYSDIYALGITFWEVLCEEIPYGNADNMGVMFEVKNNGARPKCNHPRFPKEFKKLLRDLWDQNPKKRMNSWDLKNWFNQNVNHLKVKYSNFRFPQ